MAFRVDIGSPLRPAKYLADGGARFDAILTRAGVFTYWVDGKPFLEFRPESEVFDAESMASFEALPATDDHPAEGGVTPQNRDALKRGRVGDTVKRDALNMVGALIIDDAGLLAKIRAGKVEVSCGYTCDLELKPGEWNGIRYDAVQRNIRGNHVAIVDRGRAGNARVRVDGHQCEDVPEARAAEPSPPKSAQRTDNMQLEELLKKLGEVTADGEKQRHRADTATAERDAARAERDAARAQLDTMRAERDTAKKDAEDAAKAREDAAKDGPERARESAKTIAKGVVMLGADAKIKIDGKDVDIFDADPHAIRLAAIQKIHKVDCSKESEAYVRVRFDLAFDTLDKSRAALDAARVVAEPTPRVDGDGKAAPSNGDAYTRENEARKKMNKRHQDAWKADDEGKE
jgi:hypothetical protein